MITEKELQEAIARIGRTADGEALYLYCQRFLCRVVHSSDVGALQIETGKRMFAQELMGLMSQGLSETYAGSRNDRICIFSVPDRKSVRPGGSHRRGFVGDQQFQSEFTDPAADDGAGGTS